jgi:ABC-2 type transport system permease protein
MLLFHIWIYNILLFVLFLAITSAIFASIGVMLGLWAKNIEDVGNIMSYMLSPLLFLGGVFFPISIVPAEWIRWISWLDPLTYIINGFRYAMIGGARTTDPSLCLLAIIVSLVICFYASLKMFESGYNLKT